MEILIISVLAILSYLLGSIPSSVWLGMRFANVDVREHGSGNAGATNTFRVLGKKLGTAVLLMDVAKGLAAVSLVYLLKYVPITNHSGWGETTIVNLQLLFGILAVVGHIFPVFAQFKGGKGIATLLGMVIGISYPLALCCIAIFLVVLFATKYVSLSSMLATISYPILAFFVFHRTEILLLLFGIVAAIMVVITHKKNIVRLVNGQESKANLFRKK
jgi:glycerol-3-phosphate acyltransferase PlsY